MAESAERNLRLFRELITCTHNLSFWTYDTHFSLTYTNCPDPDLINMLFISVKDSIPLDTDLPMIVSSGLGFSWAVNMERDGLGTPLYYHVIGPVIASQISINKAKEAIMQKHGVSYTLAKTVDELIARIPTIPLTRLMEYSLMLHYCITEEKLTVDSILFPESHPVMPKQDVGSTANPYGTWLMEQKLLKLVEDGNLNFRRESSRLVAGAAPADLGGGDIIRHYKNLVIAFTASCTRAAIRGGLTPEIAYMISDKYIRGVEACTTLPELVEHNDSMQEEFIRRVHQVKTGGLSPQIQQVCNYIQLHVEEELSLSAISSSVGYSPQWLSSKFHKETGKTVSQYVTEQKVAWAQKMLLSYSYPIQEIAERLHYKTPSHFGAVFRQCTGISPGEYRSRGREKNGEKVSDVQL